MRGLGGRRQCADTHCMHTQYIQVDPIVNRTPVRTLGCDWPHRARETKWSNLVHIRYTCFSFHAVSLRQTVKRDARVLTVPTCQISQQIAVCLWFDESCMDHSGCKHRRISLNNAKPWSTSCFYSFPVVSASLPSLHANYFLRHLSDRLSIRQYNTWEWLSLPRGRSEESASLASCYFQRTLLRSSKEKPATSGASNSSRQPRAKGGQGMYLNPRVPAGVVHPAKKVTNPQLHSREADRLKLDLNDQHVAITAAVFGDANACLVSRRGAVQEAHFTRTVSLSSQPAGAFVGGHHRVAWFTDGDRRADENKQNVRGRGRSMMNRK